MTAWFPPEASIYFSFMVFSSFTALTAAWIKKGKHRRFVIALWGTIGLLALGVALLGIVGQITGQPRHVWLTMIASGTPIALTYLGLVPLLDFYYRRAEQRRVSALDL